MRPGRPATLPRHSPPAPTMSWGIVCRALRIPLACCRSKVKFSSRMNSFGSESKLRTVTVRQIFFLYILSSGAL